MDSSLKFPNRETLVLTISNILGNLESNKLNCIFMLALKIPQEMGFTLICRVCTAGNMVRRRGEEEEEEEKRRRRRRKRG